MDSSNSDVCYLSTKVCQQLVERVLDTALPPGTLVDTYHIMKTAQGSSTVAIITTASIMAPLMESLGLTPALTVLAIGAGAMTVSHANDSYFWVVSQFSDMEVPVAYRAYTTATLVEGIVAIIVVAIMSVFF